MSGVFENAIRTFLSPIAELLDDDAVSEVMINGPDEIFAEKKGLVYLSDCRFPSEDALMAAMRAIAQSVGRVIDDDNPILEFVFLMGLESKLSFHRWREREHLLLLENSQKTI